VDETRHYQIDGAVIGLALQRSTLLWTFLLTYVGVHAYMGFPLSAVPFSMLAFWTAYFVSRWAKGRKLMLLS
jgi:hypothetical protein